MPTIFKDLWAKWGRRWVAPILGGFAIVLSAILALQGPTPRVSTPEVPNWKLSSPTSQTQSEDASVHSHQDSPQEKSITPIERFIASESQRIGKPDPSPDESFKRLKAVARKLKRYDFQSLKLVSLNKDLETDQRFLATYVLALADQPAALDPLLQIATAQMPDADPSSPQYAEELALRTQALEGLAKFHRADRPVLTQFLAKEENSFLVQQARRLIKERRRSK